jgi:hypothetical protein
MKFFLISFAFICITLQSFSQIYRGDSIKLIPGKYNSMNESHANPFHYEEIVINSDGTFNYFVQINEFNNEKKEGHWIIKRDTLILNENNPKYKSMMKVEEVLDKNVRQGFIKFDVSKYDHNEIMYYISVTHNDTTISIDRLKGSSLIHLRGVDRFNISTSISYPAYKIKNLKANHFYVSLAQGFSFINEKWLIINGKIRPKGTNELDAGFYLDLVH